MTSKSVDADNPAFEKENGLAIRRPFTEAATSVSNGSYTLSPSMLEDKTDGCIDRLQMGLSKLWARCSSVVYTLSVVALVLALHVFLGFAINHSYENAKALMIMMILAWIAFLYYGIFKPNFGDAFNYQIWQPTTHQLGKVWNKYRIVRIAVILLIAAAYAVLLFLDPILHEPRRLVPLVGIVVFVAILFVFSKNPGKVKWHPVIGGFVLQATMGLLILRWDDGRNGFNWAANQVIKFLDYTNNGSSFVYGFVAAPPSTGAWQGVQPVFAFTILQVIIYFGAIVSLLYYLGVMQFVLTRLASVVQVAMGTTATESFNAVACIFLGQSEAPLMIKPYLTKMTDSELHAVMTSGFACVAGSLFAAYISFGACPAYILSATLMSAPVSLAVSKLFYPETQQSHVQDIKDLELPPSEERNALEAISNGAVNTVFIVAAIIANLIVFLALLALIDNCTEWFVGRLGYEGWNFEKLLGYVFFPFALIMGVSDANDWDTVYRETLTVAQLLGTKTVLNEFIAYQRLQQFIVCGTLSPRAQMMATYSLCSFSNFSSIGIQLGTIGALCESKKSTLARLAFRALFAGLMSSLLTTCLAGILISTPHPCNHGNAVCHTMNVTTAVMNANMFTTPSMM